MKIGKDNYVDINIIEFGEKNLPSKDDVHLAIKIKAYSFLGQNDIWVEGKNFCLFCSQLIDLEKNRKGEAVLKSISPNELELKIYIADEVGHFETKGKIGCYHHLRHWNAVEFNFSLEPYFITELVKIEWVKKYAKI